MPKKTTKKTIDKIIGMDPDNRLFIDSDDVIFNQLFKSFSTEPFYMETTPSKSSHFLKLWQKAKSKDD